MTAEVIETHKKGEFTMVEEEVISGVSKRQKVKEYIEARLAKQYPMPSPDDFQPPYRILHPHEMSQDGDEVWNFHFGEWCQWSEVVDCTVDEFEKYGCRKTNPIVISPRLNIVRTKREPSKYESSHPVIED